MNKHDGMDTFADLPEPLRAVAGKYGRSMVALVYGAGMCSEATKVLSHEVQRTRSAPGRHALIVLSQTFNETSSALCRLEGWSEEQLAQCDRDISLAFASAVQVPKGKIILEH